MRARWLVLCSTLLPLIGVLGCSESLEKSDIATQPGIAPVTQWVEAPCGDPLPVRFIAGQHIDIGSVTIANDESQLCVEIEVANGWVLKETHVAIALSLGGIPQTGSGNPKVGQFALSAVHNPPVTAFDHCIDLASYGYDPGEQLFIAVHAKVALLDAGGHVIQTETAWGQGLQFPGSNWAMYFNYNVQECTTPPACVVTVLSPNGEVDFCLGDPVTVAWLADGEDCASYATVELLRDGVVCSTLAEHVFSPGSLEWTAEPCGEDSTGYTIRVTDELGYWDASDVPFMIRECGGPE
jgi:hypothetical protein